LKETQPASAAELAARLGMSTAGVRYQLAQMAAEGLVEEAPPDPDRPAPGRPARRFHLTRRGAPDNLAALCTALLEIIPNGPDAAVWEQLARRLAPAPPARAAMPRRLEHAVAELAPMHYQPSWEAGPRGPLIRLKACPYATIWAKVPSVCLLDAALLSRLTAADARQTARTAFGGAGPSSCVFEIRP
jgi:predicted ArsR family transcriptional regulator